MNVPFFDLHSQLDIIGPELKAAVNDVLLSTTYIMGPKINELEENVARYCASKHGISVSSGTDALLVALMALGVGPGDFVITPTYSFFATAGVIARVGARPIFLDVEPETYNLDVQGLAELISSHDTPEKIKAIFVVHLFGQCADMTGVLKVASKYNIPVIEDAAQAIGARYLLDGQTRQAGTMGLMGCFSFFPTKNLGGIGDGGLVLTDDDELAEKLRKLRNHGASPKYYHSLIGGNFRLDAIQAAALVVKLKYLEKWNTARQKNAALYHEALNIPGIKLPIAVVPHEFHIYNQYAILVHEHRDALKDYLQQAGIGTEIYYPVPFHLQECFKYLGYNKGDFPVSEKLAASTLALPIFPELPETMQNYVIDRIRSFYQAL